MSTMGVFDTLTRCVAKAIGMYELRDLEQCMCELEAIEKEVRELKRMVYLSNRVSGLPTGENG